MRVLPESIESLRDQSWRRDAVNRIEDRAAAESFIEEVGFCSALTDRRKPGPSLYIAVCGRRDAHLPRNVQKDPECSLTWTIKDEVIRRGKTYYAKLARARTTFIAPRLIPYFNAVWGVPKNREADILSDPARAVLRVLRREWEMGTRDLREASGISKRPQFNKALDELQKTFKVIPSEVVYEPGFTYIWSLAEGRFPDELKRKVSREVALREIARAYLAGAKLTLPGELARATGLSRVDAGLGNWALVDEGFATRSAPGVYCLSQYAELVAVSSSEFQVSSAQS
ncbi:MAG TPA: hypothetical protein VJS64_16720 [Pyrinomonadaceae bacterium]|nr:hypothetical protein [Pyrinomonadaceae bacterium]